MHDPGRIIETKTPKLTFEQAKAKAEPIAKEFAAGIYEADEPEYRLGKKPVKSDKPSRIEYVCPNGKMGGVKYDLSAKPQRLRLAWVLRYPRGDTIWIDADDGRLLGGQNHRDWQQLLLSPSTIPSGCCAVLNLAGTACTLPAGIEVRANV